MKTAEQTEQWVRVLTADEAAYIIGLLRQYRSLKKTADALSIDGKYVPSRPTLSRLCREAKIKVPRGRPPGATDKIPGQRNRKLTSPRRVKALKLKARGLDVEQIAAKMKLQPCRVKALLSSARSDGVQK